MALLMSAGRVLSGCTTKPPRSSCGDGCQKPPMIVADSVASVGATIALSRPDDDHPSQTIRSAMLPCIELSKPAVVGTTSSSAGNPSSEADAAQQPARAVAPGAGVAVRTVRRTVRRTGGDSPTRPTGRARRCAPARLCRTSQPRRPHPARDLPPAHDPLTADHVVRPKSVPWGHQAEVLSPLISRPPQHPGPHGPTSFPYDSRPSSVRLPTGPQNAAAAPLSRYGCADADGTAPARRDRLGGRPRGPSASLWMPGHRASEGAANRPGARAPRLFDRRAAVPGCTTPAESLVVADRSEQ
jgi:hypothetical protein